MSRRHIPHEVSFLASTDYCLEDCVRYGKLSDYFKRSYFLSPQCTEVARLSIPPPYSCILADISILYIFANFCDGESSNVNHIVDGTCRCTDLEDCILITRVRGEYHLIKCLNRCIAIYQPYCNIIPWLPVKAHQLLNWHSSIRLHSPLFRSRPSARSGGSGARIYNFAGAVRGLVGTPPH